MNRILFPCRLFVWFSLRHLLRHRLRALTVLAGIALGAAVFTSVRISTHASVDAFQSSVQHIAGRSDLAVVRSGGRVPETLVADLLRHPQVRTVSPFLSTYVAPSREGAAPFLLVGIDPLLDTDVRRWHARDPAAGTPGSRLALLRDPYTVIVGAELALELDLTAGGVISLSHVRQDRDFTVARILSPRGLALAEGGRVAVTDIATFQEFTGVYGEVDRIDLIVVPESPAAVRKSITGLLPRGISLVSPGEFSAGSERMIRAYQTNLSVLSFAALFVGMFLVYSLVALNAASRRHELAVMRAVGATSRLLFVLFLAEGLLLGIAGWLLAIPLSTFLVRYLLHGVSSTITTLFAPLHINRLQPDPWEILLSLALTAGVAVAASWQPARNAMQVSPHEAVALPNQRPESGKRAARLALAGLGLVASVWPLSRIPPAFGIPVAGYAAALLLFLGFAFPVPWLLRKSGRFLPPLLRRIGGEPAFLAGRYLKESGTTAVVSVSALITAVALFAALTVMIFSFRQTVVAWVHQTISGDLFLQPKMSGINRNQYPLPAAVVRKLKRFGPDVEVMPFVRIQLHRQSTPFLFEALDLQTFFRHGDFFWREGDPEEALPALMEGEGVVLSEVFASQAGLNPGDRFHAMVRGSPLKATVLGIVRDYRTQGGVVFYSLDALEKKIGPTDWSGARVYAAGQGEGREETIKRVKRELLGPFGDRLELIGGPELRQAILTIFDETFAVTTVLLLIAILVAALGITSALTVMVLERSRQLATLLAVGGSIGQLRAVIFWEAVLMVFWGEAAGLACGFILSWLLIFVINYGSFGWTFLYRIDGSSLAASLPLIMLSALAAALPALRLILRQPPAILLRE